MPKRKFIIAGLVAVALLITGIASIYKSHPIFLKWMIGQASIVGKPVEAKVYTDGKFNEAIKVFSVEKTTDGKTSKYLLIDLRMQLPTILKILYASIVLPNILGSLLAPQRKILTT